MGTRPDTERGQFPMVLKQLTKYLLNHHPDWIEMNHKLTRMEKEIDKMRENQEKHDQETLHSPTIIEYINVERVTIDKYEHSNNFGALGIKSLEGRLNIGANYGLDSSLSKDMQKQKEQIIEKMHNKKASFDRQSKPTSVPKTHIRSR